ncbi:MAG: peptidoglycan-associated lipoprotein Pal [candidate division Zixibacteria bacterium]|nr:peptidoglycan-associated lipoprotein Pal [candidate division Zixibacteria bacterium]
MRAFKLSMIFLIAGLLSFGALCGGKKEPTLPPPKPPETIEDEPEIDRGEIEGEFPEPKEEEKEPLVIDERVYFDFNKYNLKPEARGTLREIADAMREYPEAFLLIEGHCDERGTEQYNLALGEKRAQEARKFLVSAGVESNRIDIISYGEERPADPGHNERAWAKNRRCEFEVTE